MRGGEGGTIMAGPWPHLVSLLHWVYLMSGIEGKNIFIYYLFPNIYTCLTASELLYTYISEYYFLKSLRDACSSVEMLKRYMVSERLGTPALAR